MHATNCARSRIKDVRFPESSLSRSISFAACSSRGDLLCMHDPRSMQHSSAWHGSYRQIFQCGRYLLGRICMQWLSQRVFKRRLSFFPIFSMHLPNRNDEGRLVRTGSGSCSE